MSAPLKYNPEYHNDWAWSLAIKGATDEEVATAFGVSVRTIIRWQKSYPDFQTAYREGKFIADSKVERALYKRAVGFETEEKENVVEIDPKTGEAKPVRVRSIKKQVHPDSLACMYWLNNRSRGNWTRNQEVIAETDNNSTEENNDVVIYLPEPNKDGEES